MGISTHGVSEFVLLASVCRTEICWGPLNPPYELMAAGLLSVRWHRQRFS
jgi:hypothetical protein